MSLFSILPLLLLQAGAGDVPLDSAATPPACDTPAHAAFDFWVGEWDVYPLDAKGEQGKDKVAESRIERLHAGCAIRESWMPLKGDGGSSLSNLDPHTGLWHQTWIGAAPGRVEFSGGPPSEDAMVLTGWWPAVGGPGKDAWVRMTYTRRDDGSVRQHGELSEDHGLTWGPAFDLLYRPKPAD